MPLPYNLNFENIYKDNVHSQEGVSQIRLYAPNASTEEIQKLAAVLNQSKLVDLLPKPRGSQMSFLSATSGDGTPIITVVLDDEVLISDGDNQVKRRTPENVKEKKSYVDSDQRDMIRSIVNGSYIPSVENNLNIEREISAEVMPIYASTTDYPIDVAVQVRVGKMPQQQIDNLLSKIRNGIPNSNDSNIKVRDSYGAGEKVIQIMGVENVDELSSVGIVYDKPKSKEKWKRVMEGYSFARNVLDHKSNEVSDLGPTLD